MDVTAGAGPAASFVIDGLPSLELEPSQPVIYDRPIGVRLLLRDERTGAEHYLIEYPEGLVAQRHRHRVAHTVLVLSGHLVADGRVVGPGGYCHFPARTAMHHGPAPGESCRFITIFDGPFDVEPLDDRAR